MVLVRNPQTTFTASNQALFSTASSPNGVQPQLGQADTKRFGGTNLKPVAAPRFGAKDGAEPVSNRPNFLPGAK